MSVKALLINSGDGARLRAVADRVQTAGGECRTVALDAITEELTAGVTAAMLLLGEDVEAAGTIRRVRSFLSTKAPLMVIGSASAEHRRECLGAGANLSYGADLTEAAMALEFQAMLDVCRLGLEPYDIELLQPFVAAIMEAARTMAGVPAELTGITHKKDYRMPGDVSGLVTLVGVTERLMAITLPLATAKALTSRVLRTVSDDSGFEMTFDCVGEMASIVAGQVKGRFVHTHFESEISTPSVVFGQNHEIHYRSDLPAYTVEFSSEIGAIALQLCVRDREREDPK